MIEHIEFPRPSILNAATDASVLPEPPPVLRITPFPVPLSLKLTHRCELPSPAAQESRVLYNPNSRRLECCQCGQAWQVVGRILEVLP